MDKKIFLYVALIALGLYVIPNTVEFFAGQHSFQNKTGVSCEKCHSDMIFQLQASGYVYEKHRDAAGNTNYTTYLSIGGKSYSIGVITDYSNASWIWNSSAKAWQNSITNELKNVSLDRNNNGIDGSEICMLCHNATLINATTHTGATVRVCDDDRCHGNRNYVYNSPELLGSTYRIAAAGNNISQANVHQPFYLEASNQSSPYRAGMGFGLPGNVNGSFISRGHWACLGCHGDTVVNVTIIQLPPYNHSVSNPDKPARY